MKTALLAIALAAGLLSCRVCSTTCCPSGPLLLSAEEAEILQCATGEGGPAPAEEILEALELPIVDVHTHTFNARYLPLRNILLGKRDVNPLAIFLYDAWAIRIAAAATGVATLSDGPPVPASLSSLAFEGACRASVDTDEEYEKLRGNVCVQELESMHQALIDGLAAIQAELDDKGHSIEQKGLRGDARTAAEEEAIVRAHESRLDLIEMIFDTRFHGSKAIKELKKVIGKFGFLLDTPVAQSFLTSLLAPDGEIEWLYRRQLDAGDRLKLSISHTMDLAPVYAQDEDTTVLLPFTDQLQRMNWFQSQPASQMMYFVAYNPFRDNGGNDGTALQIVKDAVEMHGAYGVKIYPPSGYRPAGNIIPPRPVALFTPEPGRQWDHRYKNVLPEDLDQRLDELFAYCVENDLPIFAHCLDGEFEARKGYARCFADPRWWRPVLRKYPELRLCFGHAGSDEFWFGVKGEREDWGRLVYELCVTYENVYCEFGVHGDIIDVEQREHFVTLLSGLIAWKRGEYSIETKILFGSDWYMPAGTKDVGEYLRGYQAAFTDRRLIDVYGPFFFANALAYLNAAERKGDARLPDRLRTSLDLLDQERKDALPLRGARK